MKRWNDEMMNVTSSVTSHVHKMTSSSSASTNDDVSIHGSWFRQEVFSAHTSPITRCRFSASGDNLAAASQDGTVRWGGWGWRSGFRVQGFGVGVRDEGGGLHYYACKGKCGYWMLYTPASWFSDDVTLQPWVAYGYEAWVMAWKSEDGTKVLGYDELATWCCCILRIWRLGRVI